jgi:hypothetical protein
MNRRSTADLSVRVYLVFVVVTARPQLLCNAVARIHGDSPPLAFLALWHRREHRVVVLGAVAWPGLPWHRRAPGVCRRGRHGCAS